MHLQLLYVVSFSPRMDACNCTALKWPIGHLEYLQKNQNIFLCEFLNPTHKDILQDERLLFKLVLQQNCNHNLSYEEVELHY